MLAPGDEQYMGSLGLPPIDAGVHTPGSIGWRPILPPPPLHAHRTTILNDKSTAGGELPNTTTPDGDDGRG